MRQGLLFRTRCIGSLVVVLLAIAPAAPAADLARARAFLAWVCSHYPEPDNVPFARMFLPTGHTRDRVFDPPMVALLKENDRLTPKGDEGVPDYDVICNCQDDEGMTVQRIVVNHTGANAVWATVDLRFAHDRTSLKFDLVQVGG